MRKIPRAETTGAAKKPAGEPWPRDGESAQAGRRGLVNWLQESDVSDGREEREEREKRREQEEREDREDRIERYNPDQWKPERRDS